MVVSTVQVGDVRIGGGAPLALIAGPCVIESLDHSLAVARQVAGICGRLGVGYVFKASFDKANRTSVESFRGPGLKPGLEVLAAVGREVGVPVTTDIHERGQAGSVAEVVDLIQIPAFLCRQTSLLEDAAATGRPLNVKKGQFLSPWDVKGIVGKAHGDGGLMITERGSTFGYNNLVVDLRSFPVIRSLGVPVVFDATHSLQLPGGRGRSSGGQREFIPHLARGAVACGVDALFMEVHPKPDQAPCDGPNMWPLDQLQELLETLLRIREAAGESISG